MQNNVAMIQEAFGEFMKGNFQAVADRCTNDVVWGSYENPAVPYAGTFKGREGVLKFFRLLSEDVEMTDFTPRDFYTQGDTVIVQGHHAGKVKKTGKTFNHDWAFFFKIRDQKVASFFSYVDSRDHFQAFTGASTGKPESQYQRPGESIPETAQTGTPRRSR